MYLLTQQAGIGISMAAQVTSHVIADLSAKFGGGGGMKRVTYLLRCCCCCCCFWGEEGGGEGQQAGRAGWSGWEWPRGLCYINYRNYRLQFVFLFNMVLLLCTYYICTATTLPPPSPLASGFSPPPPPRSPLPLVVVPKLDTDGVPELQSVVAAWESRHSGGWIGLWLLNSVLTPPAARPRSGKGLLIYLYLSIYLSITLSLYIYMSSFDCRFLDCH